jgi:hypothetical protein
MIETPGRYAATVTGAQFGQSPKNGTPYLELNLETDAGERISAWLYLSPKAFENTTRRLREAFGFNGDYETAVQQVRGKPCSITVEEEETEDGKRRLRVAWVNPPRVVKPVEDGFLAQLTAKARKLGLAAPSVSADDSGNCPF